MRASQADLLDITSFSYPPFTGPVFGMGNIQRQAIEPGKGVVVDAPSEPFFPSHGSRPADGSYKMVFSLDAQRPMPAGV